MSHSPHHRRPFNPFARGTTSRPPRNALTYRDNRYATTTTSKGGGRRMVIVVSMGCLCLVYWVMMVAWEPETPTITLEQNEHQLLASGQEHFPTRAPVSSSIFEKDEEVEEEEDEETYHSPPLRRKPQVTAAPTLAPTKQPTATPTKQPTAKPTLPPTVPPETDRHLPPTVPPDDEKKTTTTTTTANANATNTANTVVGSHDEVSNDHNMTSPVDHSVGNITTNHTREESRQDIDDEEADSIATNETREGNHEDSNSTTTEGEAGIETNHRTTNHPDEIGAFESETLVPENNTTGNKNEEMQLDTESSNNTTEAIDSSNHTTTVQNETDILGNETIVDTSTAAVNLFDNSTETNRTKAHAVYQVVASGTSDSTHPNSSSATDIKDEITTGSKKDSKHADSKHVISQTKNESETSSYHSTDLIKDQSIDVNETLANASSPLETDTNKNAESLVASDDSAMNATTVMTTPLVNKSNETNPTFLLQNDTSDTTSDS